MNFFQSFSKIDEENADESDEDYNPENENFSEEEGFVFDSEEDISSDKEFAVTQKKLEKESKLHDKGKPLFYANSKLSKYEAEKKMFDKKKFFVGDDFETLKKTLAAKLPKERMISMSKKIKSETAEKMKRYALFDFEMKKKQPGKTVFVEEEWPVTFKFEAGKEPKVIFKNS